MGRGFSVAEDSAVPCPCGSGQRYAVCCAPLHQGLVMADTAEQLMRSRYSAFAKGQVDYLIKTHLDRENSPARQRRDLRAHCRQTRWLELRIQAVEGGGSGDLTGCVRFEADFKESGQHRILKEASLFKRCGDRIEGDWLYLRPLSLELVHA